MSKYFDLMQEIEKDPEFRFDQQIKPDFPTPGENRNENAHSYSPSDSTLTLVQRIFLQQAQESPRVVVFAGIDHGNGCSQIATSVAETLAGNAHGAVCLVEANFRSPGLPGTLGTTNYSGLTNALREEGSIRSFLKPVSDGRLWLLSSGPLAADSPNLLTSQRMSARSAELRKEFDFVIVDAPPMTRYADAISLGLLSDGVVLVLEANSTHRETALAAAESLRSSGIKILAAVLNKRTFPIPEGIYGKL
jgi:Mrp family chromosome partitioning ATPase